MGRSLRVIAFLVVVVGVTVGIVVYWQTHRTWSSSEASSQLAGMTSTRDRLLNSVYDEIDRDDQQAFDVDCTRLGDTDNQLSHRLGSGRWPSSAKYAAQQFEQSVRAQASDLNGCASGRAGGFTMTNTSGPETALIELLNG